MGPFETVWGHLEILGTTWDHLRPFGEREWRESGRECEESGERVGR